jgi:hypothetical protein
VGWLISLSRISWSTLLSKTYAIGFATLSDGGEKSPTFPAAIGDVQRLPRRPNQFLIQSLLIHVYGFHVPVSAQFLVQITTRIIHNRWKWTNRSH